MELLAVLGITCAWLVGNACCWIGAVLIDAWEGWQDERAYTKRYQQSAKREEQR